MRSFAIVLSALAAFAVAQDSSTVTSIPQPSNPNTQYLTQTDSNGVITGQPTVVTSQPTNPAVVTSQPLPASLPALGDGLQTVTQGNNTYTVSVSGSSTSFVISTSTTSSASGSGASAGASGTGSSSSAKGAAATGKAAAGALIGAAGLFAALL